MPEGFHLIKGNRKDSPKVEAVPIWLRRQAQGSFAALPQLTARKGEQWEMRSLRVIKALHFALLPGRGWLLSSGQRSPCSGYGPGSRREGLGTLPETLCPVAQLSLEQSALAHQRLVPFAHPPTHSACVGAHPSPHQGSHPCVGPANACSSCQGGPCAGCPHPQELSTSVRSWK